MTSISDGPLASALALVAQGRLKTEPVMTCASLEDLYSAYAAAIHRFLCDVLGDPAAARDATQETFVRAFQRLHTLEAKDRPAPWLFGIARNVSMEMRRARRRRRKILDEDPPEAWEEHSANAETPEQEALGRETIRRLQRALADLSEDRRAALLLRLDHDMSYEDIAQTMGWSIAKAKVEVHRARQALRENLDPSEGGIP